MGAAEIVERWRTGVADLMRGAGPPPRPSRWMWTADAILAFVLAACTVATALRQDGGESGRVDLPPPMGPFPPLPAVAPTPPAPPHPPPLGVHLGHALGALQPWQLVLAALTALPLVARRRSPLAAFWAVTGTTLLFHHSSGAGDTAVYTFVSCVIAAYSSAVHSPYRVRAITSLLAGAGLVSVFHDNNVPNVTAGFVPFLVLLGFGLTANTIHTWKQRVRSLEERHESATRQAVDRERARIARDLHDVVTHNVSVMVIQAGAARKVMDTAPDRAREALLAVEAGGRTAMAELRHVMGLLTMSGDGPDPGTGADLAPQPDLQQVAGLTDRIRDTGVDVELTVSGDPRPLPAGIGLAGYRVVQEALTNTVKHAAGARVRVAVAHTPGAVRIEVTDTGGTSTAPAGSGAGRGLIGLRERLAVYGGTLDAGGLPSGGYRVRALIPVGEPSPTPGGELS